jgi:predicted PurR-regulated permease PerM
MLGFDTRTAKVIWTVFLVTFLLFFVYSIRQTLLVVTFAIFFSYMVYPLIALAERHLPSTIPRMVSIGAVFALVFIIIVVAGSVLGSQIADEASKLSQQLPSLLNVKNISDRIPLPGFLEPLRVRLVVFLSEQMQSHAGQAVPFAQELGLSALRAASNLIYLVLVPVLSFLLIKEASTLKREMFAWIGQSNSLLWGGIITDLDVLMAGYVRALLILSIATGVVYSTVFSFMGITYALLLGVIAGLLEVIPFVGPLIAAVAVLAVSAFSGYPHLAWLFVFIVGYRLFQDYVLNPYLMSAGIEVPPLLVILGLLAGEQAGGIAGIFLAVPVVAAVKIIYLQITANGRSAGTAMR